MDKEQREIERLADIAVILREHEDIEKATISRNGYEMTVTFKDGSRYKMEMLREIKGPAA